MCKFHHTNLFHHLRSRVYHIIVVGLIALFILAPVCADAQQKSRVNIENSDYLKFDKREGRNINRLIGHVVLRQDSTWFYCDSAILDKKLNFLYAFGHVHINYSDSVDVYGKYLVYDGNEKIATLDTNVRMVDNRSTLYSDHLIYNRKNRWAFYNTGGRIVDGENVLTSRIGRYYTDTKKLFYKDSVVLVNPDYTLRSDTLMYNTETEVAYIYGPTEITGESDSIYAERGWYDTQNDITRLQKNAFVRHMEQMLSADSIFYVRGQGYGYAWSNIKMDDTVQDVVVLGNYAEFDRTAGVSYVTDSAVAIIIDEQDSLFMHADTMKIITDSAEKARKLFAYYKMKFFRKDLQGACDSMVYDIQDSIIYLYEQPVLWSDENQLTGDSILIYVSHNSIDSMSLFGTAFIISHDSIQSFNQIKGRTMTAYFKKNKLSTIEVIGNAETIYYVREDDGALIGINKSISSSMMIKVEESKVKSITYFEQPDAALHPEGGLAEQDLVLRGFKWDEGVRPLVVGDIFRW